MSRSFKDWKHVARFLCTLAAMVTFIYLFVVGINGNRAALLVLAGFFGALGLYCIIAAAYEISCVGESRLSRLSVNRHAKGEQE